MQREHEIKCRPEYFARLVSGQKRFEIRLNDRDYQVGDTLIIREHDEKKGWPDHGSYGTAVFPIIYMTSFMQQENYVVLGLGERIVEEDHDLIPY